MPRPRAPGEALAFVDIKRGENEFPSLPRAFLDGLQLRYGEGGVIKTSDDREYYREGPRLMTIVEDAPPKAKSASGGGAKSTPQRSHPEA
jgi:hypothetical protein